MAQTLTPNGVQGYCGRDLERAGAVRYTDSANGAAKRSAFKSYLVDINGGASVTITGAIPAGAHNLIVVARVITIIAGSDGVASWKLGDSDDDHFGAELALAAGTIAQPTTYTAQPTALYTAAADIVIAGTGGKLIESGQVRVDLWYDLYTAPTS